MGGAKSATTGVTNGAKGATNGAASGAKAVNSGVTSGVEPHLSSAPSQTTDTKASTETRSFRDGGPDAACVPWPNSPRG